MSSDVQRQIGEHVAEQVDKLPDEIGPYLCGCWPEDVQEVDGVLWAYTRALSFHDPDVPHGAPSDRDSELAALYFLTQHGEGGVG